MEVEDVEALARLPLFDGVDRGRLEDLVAASSRSHVSSGEVLLRQGEPGDHVVLVLAGEASVATRGVVVGSIGAGDCVGEMAAFDGSVRSATVDATTDLQALIVPAAAFRALVGAEPVLAARLATTLRTRLREAQSEWASLAGDPEVLLVTLLELQDSPDADVAERARLHAATVLAAAVARAEPTPSEPDALAALSPAEHRVVVLVAEGLSNAGIAERLFLSRHTVDTHMKHSYTKLGVHSRVDLAALVLRRA